VWLLLIVVIALIDLVWLFLAVTGLLGIGLIDLVWLFIATLIVVVFMIVLVAIHSCDRMGYRSMAAIIIAVVIYESMIIVMFVGRNDQAWQMYILSAYASLGVRYLDAVFDHIM
jgi:hypothetical protein